ncbi:MAG: hypothetical protein EHM28_08305 [Spirochaetaceae bacterium]|nr:MAG: hypothetical protein EHM28_08305 [Spirochaetaceae bacterium]
MKELLIPGIKLFVICFAAALSLGFVNEITKDKISEARAEKEKKALSEFEFDGILGNRLVVPPTTIKKEIFQQKIIERLSTEEEKTLLNRVYSVSDTDATLSVSLSPELLVAVAKAITGTGFESGEKIRTMFVVMKENAEAGKVITGYVLEVHGNGYGGDMKIFAFYSPDGTILGLRIVQKNETTRMGKKEEDTE